MIFTIIKTYRDVKSGVKDPTGFGKDALLEIIKIPLLVFTVGGVLALVLFFILGWTDLLSGPFGFFKFVFWFLFIPFFILEIVFWKIYSKAKALVQKAKNRVDERMNTIDVEVR